MIKSCSLNNRRTSCAFIVRLLRRGWWDFHWAWLSLERLWRSSVRIRCWLVSPGSTASYIVKQLSQSAIFRSSSFSGSSATKRECGGGSQQKALSHGGSQTFVVITGNIAIHQTQHVLCLHHQQMVVVDVLWMLKNELLELLGTFFNKTI